MEQVIFIRVQSLDELAELAPNDNYFVQVYDTGQLFKGNQLSNGVVEVPTANTSLFANTFLLMGG